MTDYIREIQMWHKDDNNMTLSFWIPQSYWKIALENSPQVPKELLEQIESAFENYVFVCALDLQINMDGTMTYTDELSLRKTITITDVSGKTHQPLQENQLNEDALTFSRTLKPMFAQMLGQMGAGMHLYFFEIKDAEKNNLINEYKKSNFSIEHSNKTFKYQLPLVTLLPSKKCPVDGAEMKGNWMYCPIHGTEL